MMDHDTAETIARAVLARGKAALPARFPVVTTETVSVWSDLFARYGVNYPCPGLARRRGPLRSENG